MFRAHAKTNDILTLMTQVKSRHSKAFERVKYVVLHFQVCLAHGTVTCLSQVNAQMHDTSNKAAPNFNAALGANTVLQQCMECTQRLTKCFVVKQLRGRSDVFHRVKAY